jgi:predicted acyltransferase
VVIGFFAGKFIQDKGKTFECLSKLMLVGALFIFIALCWNISFPINKKLWTSPFVLLTCGLDLIIISALIYILEMRKWNPIRWSGFFQIFGRNPLFIYILSELLFVVLIMLHVSQIENVYDYINRIIFQVIAPGAFGSFLFAICYMLVCWSIGWWLNKRRIYVKV